MPAFASRSEFLKVFCEHQAFSLCAISSLTWLPECGMPSFSRQAQQLLWLAYLFSSSYAPLFPLKILIS